MDAFAETSGEKVMTKIHIDKATNTQLDYAAAVAQEIEAIITGGACVIKQGFYSAEEIYNPTGDQAQCFDLIQQFKILCSWNQESGDSEPDYLDMWYCNVYGSYFFDTDASLNIAAVKAFLLSVYPDGMIETVNE